MRSPVPIRCTSKALGDLARLHAFLAEVNRNAAGNIVRWLTTAAKRLQEYPHLGERLEEFKPREVRRLIVGNYEMRYEISDRRVFMLNIWHAKGDR